MSFYSNMQSVATNLLTKYGQIVTLTRETVTDYDPVLGAETKTTTTFTCYGAIFNYEQSEIDGAAIQRGDSRLILQSLSAAPAADDFVTVDGRVYRVMNVTITAPGGTVVIYELQLRY